MTTAYDNDAARDAADHYRDVTSGEERAAYAALTEMDRAHDGPCHHRRMDAHGCDDCGVQV